MPKCKTRSMPSAFRAAQRAAALTPRPKQPRVASLQLACLRRCWSAPRPIDTSGLPEALRELAVHPSSVERRNLSEPGGDQWIRPIEERMFILFCGHAVFEGIRLLLPRQTSAARRFGARVFAAYNPEHLQFYRDVLHVGGPDVAMRFAAGCLREHTLCRSVLETSVHRGKAAEAIVLLDAIGFAISSYDLEYIAGRAKYRQWMGCEVAARSMDTLVARYPECADVRPVRLIF